MYYQFKNPILQRDRLLIIQAIQKQTDDFDLQNAFLMQLDEYPDITKKFIQYYFKPNKFKLEMILNLFLQHSHNFFAVGGTVGSGKTSLVYFLLKCLSQFTNKKIYWVGKMNSSKVPCFAKHVFLNYRLMKKIHFYNNSVFKGKADRECFDYILKFFRQYVSTAFKDKEFGETISVFDIFPKGSIVYFDELSHIFPKGSIKEEDLEELSIYRHNDLTIIGSTQNSAIVSIDMLRFFTGMFILQTTEFHSEHERNDDLTKVLNLFRPTSFGECLFYSNILTKEFVLPFKYPLLSEYENNYSKSFGGII